MKIDELNYKGYNIEIKYVKAVKMFYAKSVIGFTSEHKNVDDAINEKKKLIDGFISIEIKDYNKLTEELTKSIYLHDYEEYTLDVDMVKHLVEAFIKSKSIDLKQNGSVRSDEDIQKRIDEAYVQLSQSVETPQRWDMEITCEALAVFSPVVFLFVRGNELVADQFLDAVLKLDKEYYDYILSAIDHFYHYTKKN